MRQASRRPEPDEPARASGPPARFDRKWFEIIAPPKTRGRKREARHWLDVLAARCFNGIPRKRRPGARLISYRESVQIWESSLAALAVRDSSLYAAVREVMFWDGVAELYVPHEKWKARALRRADRVARIRAALPPEDSA